MIANKRLLGWLAATGLMVSVVPAIAQVAPSGAGGAGGAGAAGAGAARGGRGGRGGGAIPDDPASVIQTLAGFKLEMVHKADPAKNGSWISLTKDDKGRLLLGGQASQALTRLTIADGKVSKEEVAKLPVSEIMGQLLVGDALYVTGQASLPGDDAGGAAGGRGGRGGTYGLYRLRDPQGNFSYSSVERLRTWPRGSGEHGGHALILSADKQRLIEVNGNQVPQPTDEVANPPLRNMAYDQVIPKIKGGFMSGEKPPGGSIISMDLDGKNPITLAGGERNTYDIAMNADGEIIGYDSDMEWDWGLPWYRPTRIFHATLGADTGYRGEAGKYPTWYEDSLPPVVEIGVGCPTGTTFGYGTKFPARYQKALYVMDWTYGRLIAIHLQPRGFSYEATWENFVAPKGLHGTTGKTALNYTDTVIGDDGALYFTIGGRNNQAYLFRVVYTGGESTAPVDYHDRVVPEERNTRHTLEAFQTKNDPAAVATAWPYLGSDDRFMRYAARMAVETQPAASWKAKALAEPNPQASIEALLALARLGGKETNEEVLAALAKLPLSALGEDLKIQKLRVIEVAIARNGKPSNATLQALTAELEPEFPSYTFPLNNELSQILTVIDPANAVAKTVRLLQGTRIMEEEIAYLGNLRGATEGWTPDLRKAYFTWFTTNHANDLHSDRTNAFFTLAGTRFNTGNEYGQYLGNIFTDASATLTSAEKEDQALATILTANISGRGGRGRGCAAAPANRGGGPGGVPVPTTAPAR